METFKSIDDIALQYPDWQQAELHSKSLLVGRPISNNHTLSEKQSFCNCCGNQIQKQYIPLCENTKQLEFLGVGFPLYYTFLKYCIILLILETISSSTLNLIDDMNDNYNFCIKNIPKTVPNDGREVECTSISIYFADLQDHLISNTIVLRISYFATALLFYIYMRDSLRKLIHYYDERSTTYSDYTLLMKHLPSKSGIKEDLRVLLTGFKVREITVIGAFDHIQKMEEGLKSMQAIKAKRIEVIKSKNMTLDEAQIFLRQLQYLNKDIVDAQRRLYQGIRQQQKLYQMDEIIPIRALVCVETDEQKEKILKMLHQKQHQHIPDDWIESDISSLHISQAPQPKQIIWQNLNLPMKQKLKSYAIGWTITFLLLLIITMLFYFIMNWLTTSIQHQVINGLDKARALFYCLLVVVVMINKFIISPLLHKICHYEKYFTKSKEEFGFTLKYLLCMFFTTAMMTVFVDVLTKNNIYSQSFGVIEGETAMIFINSFLIPLIWLINPWTIFLKIKRWYYRSKAGVTQDQANNMMQSLPYQLGKRFAEIIKLMWLVSLYQSLIPMGTMIAIIGLTLYYWIDKYNLLRRSSVKQSVSGALTMRVMSLLQFSLILKQSGELFFDVWIRYEYNISTVICLVLAVVYFFLPKNSILECLHHEKFHKEEKQLSESRTQLGVGYDELHPITGTKMRNLVESISKKKRKPIDYLYQYKSIISKVSIEENMYSNRILKSFKRQIRQKQHRQAFHESNKVQLLRQNMENTHL